MPSILNRHQPVRPTEDESTKTRLLYRTYPYLPEERDDHTRTYRVMEPANQLCQMQLYRWSRSDEFVTAPACGELYDYLIGDMFVIDSVLYKPSKGHFGRTITNALNYNPRKLKGVTKDNPKACQVYYLHSKLELQYGLEYMICSWLRKFLNDTAAQGAEPISGPTMMEEELDILVSSSWADYLQVYVEPLQTMRNVYEEPDWRSLLKQFNVNDTPEGIDIPEPNRKKLRSF